MMDLYETTQPEIRRVLVLSTGHAERRTINEFSGDTFIASYPYGAYFHVPGDLEETEVPDDLRIVLDYAHKLRCNEVKFDSDALFVPDLPRYEW